MQPTLNGIIGTPLKRDQWPSFTRADVGEGHARPNFRACGQ